MMTITVCRDRATVHPVEPEPHVGVVALDAVRTKLQPIDGLYQGAVEDEPPDLRVESRSTP